MLNEQSISLSSDWKPDLPSFNYPQRVVEFEVTRPCKSYAPILRHILMQSHCLNSAIGVDEFTA